MNVYGVVIVLMVVITVFVYCANLYAAVRGRVIEMQSANMCLCVYWESVTIWHLIDDYDR